jgi:serine protease inhibitor
MPNMQIQEIAQQVKIIVKETETEAAAVTSFFAAGCPPPEIEKRPITMTVNRPFLFEIVEDFSNTILFTGIINNIDEIC